MSPIVAAPQVAIGAMGKIQRLPRFTSKDSTEVEEVNILQISWGGDHRVIDGATLARFSNRWKDLMENPMSMVFCLK
jgi:2-oxoisovalerate dehydrogenase E2 component (dihydrolipoyl transacylase)